MTLALRIKEQARLLGFELAGIAPAGPADGFDRLADWLAQGFAGEMDYMGRHGEARQHPRSILASVKSVLMVAMNYKPEADAGGLAEGNASGSARPQAAGRVARYARGEDYHTVLRRRLNALLDWIQRVAPGTQGRGVVDTAPLLERDFARRAGLGWFGKNTMLIHKKLGSYFFLGALLLDLELPADAPFAASHCGTCTACLDACPTQAFVGPGQLDSRRCISYLTIELRGPIDPRLRTGLGDWVFGCDICQEVCPWNNKAPPGLEPALQPRSQMESMDLLELLGLTEEEFRRRFRGTALLRTKRRCLARNAALVLGNRGDPSALPALEKARAQDPDPVVREAAQWAIDEIQSRGAHAPTPRS